MIVDDDSVAAALAYLNDAEIAAEVRYNATMRENASREIFANVFLSHNIGTVAEREARATCNPEYVQAKKLESEAIRELERHRARVKSSEMVIEIWRTENANARAAERIR